MKTQQTLIALIVSVFVLCCVPLASWCQSSTGYKTPFSERNLSGPRLGVTLLIPGEEMKKQLAERGIKDLISQFGWHFEYQVIPDGGGPQFVVQFVPLVAGVEYGKFIPSVTLGLGIRMPNGFEFGLGPNLVAGTDPEISTALMMTVGKSFDFGGVSIPVNMVWVTNPRGNRASIIFGYAIE